MKKQQTQSEMVGKLRLNRETLRQLQSSELQRVDGAIGGTSIDTQTTNHCCVTL